MPLVPELYAAGAVVSWQPATVAGALRERLEETHLPARLRGRAFLRLEDALDTVERAHALDVLPQGQPVTFEGQAPALAARGVTEAETELRALVGRGLSIVVAFPHRGEAERTAMQLRRIEARVLEPDEGLPNRPGVAFVEGRLRRGFVAPALGIAVLPSTQVFRRAVAPDRPARRPRDRLVHGPAARRLRRARGPRRRALRGLRHQDGRRRHARLPRAGVQGRGPHLPAARAAREAVALHRRRRPPARALEARRQGLARAQGPGPPRGARDGRRAARPLRRAPGGARHRVRARRRAHAPARGRLPVLRDGRPGAGDRGREERPRGAAADGPPDLRRRRASARPRSRSGPR